MTLDEAIKHCRKVAWQNENAAVMYKQKKEASRFLEKALAEKAELDCLQCVEDHRQLAEWLRELKQYRNDNKWISCKEQMPEDGISILICSERGTISKATYDSDMGYFYIADSELHYNQLDITHWQPLPQPPKEGE